MTSLLRNILLVDDVDVQRDYVHGIIVDHLGIDDADADEFIVTCTDYQSAQEFAIGARPFEVAVVDLCLGPDENRDGLLLLQLLYERQPDCFRILHTSHSDPTAVDVPRYIDEFVTLQSGRRDRRAQVEAALRRAEERLRRRSIADQRIELTEST